jgi:nitrogen PTS system EIIA component
MNTHFQLLPQAVGIAGSSSKAEVIASMAGLFAQVYGIEQDLLAERLTDREAMGSTGFGRGVAIPHARVPNVHRPVSAFLRLTRPVEFEAADSAPVRLVFGLVSPEQSGSAHLHALAAISRLMRDERLRESLLSARGEEELYGLLANVIERDAA